MGPLMAALREAWANLRAALRRTQILVLAIVLVPTALLLLRWEDPGRGQIPFGWQMHTSCWGDLSDTECEAP